MVIDVNITARVAVQSVEVEPPPPPPTVIYDGWRWLHGVEGGRMPPLGMPEVVPPLETRALEMTQAIQLLSWNLMRHFCPPMEPKKWRAAHKHDRAMNNGDQNGYDGGIAHADWVNNLDLKATLPRYDKMQRGFGGTFFRAVDEGDRLRCDPGIHGIDATRALPSIETIVANNWFVYGVSIGVNDPARISHFPQAYYDGIGYPLVYPFIFDRPIYFRKDEAERWVGDTLPDPLRIYRTSTTVRKPQPDF